MGKPRKKPDPKAPARKLVWRVRVTMAERGIRTVTRLAALLHEQAGVVISVSQLGRMIDGKTQLINVEAVEGLMTVLDCGLGGIFTEQVRS